MKSHSLAVTLLVLTLVSIAFSTPQDRFLPESNELQDQSLSPDGFSPNSVQLETQVQSLSPTADAEGEHLCAPMVFSAQYHDLYAPSQPLLLAQCHAICESARNAGSNTFGACFWKNVGDIVVSHAYAIRIKRCTERCTGQTAFEGDCGCEVDAQNVYVAVDGEMFEDCTATALVNKVFSANGWIKKYGTESAARPCPNQ